MPRIYVSRPFSGARSWIKELCPPWLREETHIQTHVVFRLMPKTLFDDVSMARVDVTLQDYLNDRGTAMTLLLTPSG